MGEAKKRRAAGLPFKNVSRESQRAEKKKIQGVLDDQEFYGSLYEFSEGDFCELGLNDETGELEPITE